MVGYAERDKREKAEEREKRQLIVPLADMSTGMGRGAGNGEVSEGRGWRLEERSAEGNNTGGC